MNTGLHWEGLLRGLYKALVRVLLGNPCVTVVLFQRVVINRYLNPTTVKIPVSNAERTLSVKFSKRYWIWWCDECYTTGSALASEFWYLHAFTYLQKGSPGRVCKQALWTRRAGSTICKERDNWMFGSKASSNSVFKDLLNQLPWYIGT